MGYYMWNIDHVEERYTFEESLKHIEMLRKSEDIILGGDVLDAEGNYTYINWHFDCEKIETASADSCDHAEKFIKRLPDNEKYQYIFVTITYNDYIRRRWR